MKTTELVCVYRLSRMPRWLWNTWTREHQRKYVNVIAYLTDILPYWQQYLDWYCYIFPQWSKFSLIGTDIHIFVCLFFFFDPFPLHHCLLTSIIIIYILFFFFYFIFTLVHPIEWQTSTCNGCISNWPKISLKQKLPNSTNTGQTQASAHHRIKRIWN